MKKLICLITALVLCFGLLAGCGGNKPSSGGNEGSGDSGEAVDVTVTVWGPQEDQSDDNGKWLQTQCEAFAAAHPEWNITFNYDPRSDQGRRHFRARRLQCRHHEEQQLGDDRQHGYL